VVDQSSEPIEINLPKTSTIRTLVYIHDPQITGASMARNCGIERAKGEILVFVDDDEILERDYLFELIAVYCSFPDVQGVSGVVTNYAKPSLAFRLWDRITHVGKFHDDRQPLYWKARNKGFLPVPVSRFGGGTMSFRASALRDIRFDEHLAGTCFGEDVEFSARFSRLLMHGNARLQHNHSQHGRSVDHWLQLRIRADYYFAHRLNWCGPSFYWCTAMNWLTCATLSALTRSRQPMKWFAAGLSQARADLGKR
jgi:glycosyltransferase involved in cell wall biosynthesis